KPYWTEWLERTSALPINLGKMILTNRTPVPNAGYRSADFPVRSNIRTLAVSGRFVRALPIERCCGLESLRSGFTLIELILVMTILTIAVSLTAPALANFFRGRTLDSEARRLLAA